MTANDPTGGFILMLDMHGHERYLNPAAIADVQYLKDGGRGGEPRAVVTLTAPVAASGQHQIHFAGAQAVALRAELRRRMGLPDEDAPDPAPLSVPKNSRQLMSFQR